MDVADLVTLIRSGVETDYQGDVLFAHAPEVPTRLVKQLGQLMRGAVALGLSVDRAFQMALRVCRDCAPPTRLRVLLDVADHPDTKAAECARRLGLPRQTTQRLCDILRALELLELDEIEDVPGKPWITTSRYTLAPTVKRTSLARLAPPPTPPGKVSRGRCGRRGSSRRRGLQHPYSHFRAASPGAGRRVRRGRSGARVTAVLGRGGEHLEAPRAHVALGPARPWDARERPTRYLGMSRPGPPRFRHVGKDRGGAGVPWVLSAHGRETRAGNARFSTRLDH